MDPNYRAFLWKSQVKKQNKTKQKYVLFVGLRKGLDLVPYDMIWFMIIYGLSKLKEIF